jgi:hypothetical protein
MQNMKFSETHQKVLEELLTISPPESAVSITTNPILTKAVSNIRTEALLKHLAPKLETVAQHREEQEQEAYNPGSGSTSVLPLGAEAAGYSPQSRHQIREELPRRGTPYPRSPYLHQPEEQVGRSGPIFGNPVVEDVRKMGSPFSPTSHHSKQIPDPPWFLKPQLPDMPAITTVNQQGQTIELPYMRYALMDEEPMLLGTDKKGGDVYREYLQATPMPDMQLHARVDDLALDELYTDYPFNWMQQLALFHLGDAGILADVHRYRQSYLKLKLMKNKNERLSRILLYAQREHEQHNKEVEALLEQVKAVKQ